MFGALALAVVMTYRSSGVSLRTGAIALYTAYVYAYLRQARFSCCSGAAHLRSIGSPFALWPALIISLVVARAAQLVLYVLIFRPLRTAPPAAVAALGVSLLIIALIAVKIGTLPVAVTRIFPPFTGTAAA